jgi:hypothetical protein
MGRPFERIPMSRPLVALRGKVVFRATMTSDAAL